MLELLQAASLAGAALTTGLTAGLFFAYSCSVMPGLARTNDRTFVITMTTVNVAIRNGWFLSGFFGSFLFTLGTATLHLATGGPGFPWVAAAAALNLATIAITGLGNIPLNEQLAKTPIDGDPEQLATARTSFEAPWNRRHALRTTTSIAAFACLVIAALLHASAHAAP